MTSSIYFYYKKDHVTKETLELLEKLAISYQFEVTKKSNVADYIICLGDDGVFLQSVRNTGFRENCTYIGMSLTNAHGLYNDFSLEEPETLFQTLTFAPVETEQFPLVDVSINDEVPFYCLNEVSIRSSIIKTIAIEVYIDNLYLERFRGDGLIVSTPSGSTAYNKSLNGAILDPTMPCFQMTEIASLNNNDYRTLGTSLVLSHNKKLRLEIIQDGNDHPIIGLDNEAYAIRNINNISVQMTNNFIHLIKLPNNNYWERIKRTFL
ncbi:NAD kinase [Paraliobacillus ryukyuensis]|uniref:NAD kinase n=1 Tax=Paraliobacillus ryukyuensis TaxID=200904 RepID=UPI0009A5F679|nr:NAD kinase [Paraliobacillus ryukyuensis]